MTQIIIEAFLCWAHWARFFTSILNVRLTEWAEENTVFTEAQAGFRQSYSTTNCIVTLHSIIEKQLSRKAKLYVAFEDIFIKRSIRWAIPCCDYPFEEGESKVRCWICSGVCMLVSKHVLAVVRAKSWTTLNASRAWIKAACAARCCSPTSSMNWRMTLSEAEATKYSFCQNRLNFSWCCL